jgi:uncharacterized membrane protein
MASDAHLWAVGYDDVGHAEHVRDVIRGLGHEHRLVVLDLAVVVRYADGSVTIDGEPFVARAKHQPHSFASLLANMALSAPLLTGPAVGSRLGSTGTAAQPTAISDEFVNEVAGMIKPGSSAVFVLDQHDDANLEAILRRIQGLGGTIVKTTVDIPRVKQIQLALAVPANYQEAPNTPRQRSLPDPALSDGKEAL